VAQVSAGLWQSRPIFFEQFSAASVKRISVGGAMSRFAFAAFLTCAREMKDRGSFIYVHADQGDQGRLRRCECIIAARFLSLP
jgi:2-methylisocitrate lyase-like PEP mutase family enzyme